MQIITATCVLHNYCLLHDDFDDGYLLPGHADGGGDGDGIEQQGPPDHGAAQKRVHLYEHCYCSLEAEKLKIN